MPNRGKVGVCAPALDSGGWGSERVLLNTFALGKASVRIWALLHKEKSNQRTHILRLTSFLISGTQKITCFHALKCRSAHRSKGRLFACFSTKPLWTSWLWLHLSDQKDKKFPNSKEKLNEKITVLLDGQNFEMASLAFQQNKIQYSTMKPSLLQRSSLCHHCFWLMAQQRQLSHNQEVWSVRICCTM